MTRAAWRISWGVILCLCLPLAPAGAQNTECVKPPNPTYEGDDLPALADALRLRRPIKIVALGSGSTAGTGASDVSASYPARLQVALAQRMPVPITVVNKGVTRQPIAQMIKRLEREVLAERPTLVIWETGTVEAVRGVDVTQFSQALQSGVQAIKQAGADVLLMTPQFSRRMVTVVNVLPYVAALRSLAANEDLVLFDRFDVMRYWSEEGVFNFEADRASPQLTQEIDRVYDCIGRLLAITIDQVAGETAQARAGR